MMRIAVARSTTGRANVLAEPRCILIVEDHSDILRIMQFVLERDGYDVRTATTVREALDILDTCEPNLLLLDLMLPEVSGWELLALRAADPRLLRIPTIVVSATHRFDPEEALKYSVFATLRKPFEPADLQALARRGLQAFAAQREDDQE
jgi:CheY-like chemotaxis protein